MSPLSAPSRRRPVGVPTRGPVIAGSPAPSRPLAVQVRPAVVVEAVVGDLTGADSSRYEKNNGRRTHHHSDGHHAEASDDRIQQSTNIPPLRPSTA